MDSTHSDSRLWKKKAAAFVTRSHRHLWGKNNEDPLAFLFTRGLKNEFSKKQLLGWNKFGQNRPPENWGVAQAAFTETKIFLPPGIVVPYIIEQELVSVFISVYGEGLPSKTMQIPGSARSTLDMGKPGSKAVFARDLFDGLFLYQEFGETHHIVIQPCPGLPLDEKIRTFMEQALTPLILCSGPEEETLNRKIFKNHPDNCFHTYSAIKDFAGCGLPA